jgi:hypothetical protein
MTMASCARPVTSQGSTSFTLSTPPTSRNERDPVKRSTSARLAGERSWSTTRVGTSVTSMLAA